MFIKYKDFLFENIDKARFEDNLIDMIGNDAKYVMKMYVGKKLAAKVEYSVYKNIYNIDMITAYVKGLGYGWVLVQKLLDTHGAQNFQNAGYHTNDGANLVKKIKQKYPRYGTAKIKTSNVLTLDDLNQIKNKTLHDFLVLAYHDGIDEAFSKYHQAILKISIKHDIDINNISDILYYVEGSFDEIASSSDGLPTEIQQTYDALLNIR
jgi:hypothetical protein